MDNAIYHHGIKGQRWGVRRYQNPDGTLTEAGKKRYSKEAAKDAKEYARAKMSYGKGAGNRRKLINATVKEKSKNSYYKEEFEKALSKQDMADHASKAKIERKVADAKESTAKTVRGIINIASGNAARAGASLIAAYGMAKVTGLDKKIVEVGKAALNKVFIK